MMQMWNTKFGVEYHFVKEHHKMQENSQLLFRVEKRSTTLLQAKTGKHECRPLRKRFFFLLLLVLEKLVMIGNMIFKENVFK